VDANPKIKFHYIKSPQYSEHPLHGVYGGMTASGQISMSVFSERAPLPKILTTEVALVEGGDGEYEMKGESREGLDGAVRFVHTTLYFDLAMARSIRKWLDDKIATFEALIDA